VTNGNGNRRCDNLLATLPLFEIAIVLLRLDYVGSVPVISDGLEARIGAIRADRERFMPWRTIEGETLAPATMPQLEVLLRGVFDKRRFLDLIRHFIMFDDDAVATGP
jgi:type I site-specific restriction-modification system R (restriction) subunit